jgi:tetraacyldisaccharide 4'-kinase
VARSKLDTWFARIWMRRGPAACLLWPWSLLFRLLSSLRRFLYRAGVLKSVRIAVPVIVVGNVFIGGTGKTPFTIWLVDALRRAGYMPGVVSRGHGVRNDAALVVTPDSPPQQAGDEPVLIAQRAHCPLVVGRDRAAAANLLLSLYPQVNVIISDDGLQHYALQRDVEIVLFDGRGAGNGWLLPAGPLREPVSRRRDFTVVNLPSRSAWPEQIRPAEAVQMRLLGTVAERLHDAAQTMPLTDLADVANVETTDRPLGARRSDARRIGARRIIAAAGIGHPERFFAMLRAAGLSFDPMPLPDHFDFTADTFAGVEADVILMTEKDAVKCRHIAALRDDLRLWVVPIAAQIDAVLADKIVEKLRGRTTA